MKRLFKMLVWLIILSPFVLTGAVIFSIEDTALVDNQFALSPAQVKRAKTLAQQHDLRNAREGEVKSVSLSVSDLNLLAGYMVDVLGGAAVVSLDEGWLDLPESLSDHEFKSQYGEIGSPAYNKVVKVIEKRIAGSRLYN